MKRLETSSLARQRYLESGVAAFRKVFHELGYTVPKNVRVSVGFPKGSHGNGKAIGQCWSEKASTDGHHEIFISPELRDTFQVLLTECHELVHATVGTACGHKGAFKKLALALGMVAPMTSSTAGPLMKATIQRITADIGKYPAGALMVANRKKQTTRLLKCQCAECDYTVRTTRFWIEKAGPPICPTDEISLVCETVDDEEG